MMTVISKGNKFFNKVKNILKNVVQNPMNFLEKLQSLQEGM